MKLAIFSDNHWSQYSSIVRSRGEKYSTRLENQIKSLNWVNKISKELGCEALVCCGDFFDKPDLNAEEITALCDIEWNDLPKYFIVGNHEMGINNLSYSSSHVFNLIPDARVIDSPNRIESCGTDICFLPYVLESGRLPLGEYFGTKTSKRVILSHNDIAGIQLGQFISKVGFSIEEIEANCDLYINGHLHNGSNVTDKIINVGNLTGQNFNEDANIYSHNIIVLDTDTLNFEKYENPYAFNFYKVDDTSSKRLVLKDNHIVSIKTTLANKESAIEYVSKAVASRVLYQLTQGEECLSNDEILTVDHLQKFTEYIIEQLGQSDEVVEELKEITK